MYTNKFSTLNEVDKSLERHKLPKLTQERIGNLDRLITSREIELIILKMPHKEKPGPNDFTGELYQAFKEELVERKIQKGLKVSFSFTRRILCPVAILNDIADGQD